MCGQNVRNQATDIRVMWSSIQVLAKASLFRENHFVLLKNQPPPIQHATVHEEWPMLKREVITTSVTPKKKIKSKLVLRGLIDKKRDTPDSNIN